MSNASQDAYRFVLKEWQQAARLKCKILLVRFGECQLPQAFAKGFVTKLSAIQRAALFPFNEQGVQRILRFLHAEMQMGVFEKAFSCLCPDKLDRRFGLKSSQLLCQPAFKTVSMDFDLPDGERKLRYRRCFNLSSPVGGSAGFDNLVDGEVVASILQHGTQEGDWGARSVVTPSRGERRARLEHKAFVSSNLNYFPNTEVWIDDIRISYRDLVSLAASHHQTT